MQLLKTVQQKRWRKPQVFCALEEEKNQGNKLVIILTFYGCFKHPSLGKICNKNHKMTKKTTPRVQYKEAVKKDAQWDILKKKCLF